MNLIEDRFLNRKNLVAFGCITLLVHLLATLLPYFGNAEWLIIVDYVFVGLLAFTAILYCAKTQLPLSASCGIK